MTRIMLYLGLAAVLHGFASPAKAGLESYVTRPEDSFSYELVSQTPVGQTQAYQVRLTSQTWHGVEWHHWLTILVPKNIEHNGEAILVIAGGDNGDEAPDADSMLLNLLARLAADCHAVLAIVQQVPNQPMFGGRDEDELIAYSFDKYFDTGDATWPLLLPMTRSAVAAMDAMQGVMKQTLGLDLKQFIVTGGSKRGWTTYLTAAADDRVSAIAPMVIDMLNLQPQLEQQLASYGEYSRMIDEYVETGVIARFDTPAGEKLRGMVDPFAYRGVLTMPKLILLGTNDPFWTVDAANLYYDALKGVTRLHYEPNVGHSLGPGIFPTLTGFFSRMLGEKPLPELEWEHTDNGALSVTWQDSAAVATLWQAHSPDRDFRDATWNSRALGGGGLCRIDVPTPAEGWSAYYVEVDFPAPNPMSLTTTMTVVPQTFPHPVPQE